MSAIWGNVAMSMLMLERPVPDGQLILYLETNEPVPVRRLIDLIGEFDKLARRKFGRDAFVELLELATGSVAARLGIWAGIAGGMAGIGSFCIDAADAMQDPGTKLNTCTARLTDGHGVVTVRLKSGECDVTITRDEIPATPPRPRRLEVDERLTRLRSHLPADTPPRDETLRYAEALLEPRSPGAAGKHPTGGRSKRIRTAGQLVRGNGEGLQLIDGAGGVCEIDEERSRVPLKELLAAKQNLLIFGTLTEFEDRKILTIDECEPLDPI